MGDESPYTLPFLVLCAIGTVAYLWVWFVKDPYHRRKP